MKGAIRPTQRGRGIIIERATGTGTAGIREAINHLSMGITPSLDSKDRAGINFIIALLEQKLGHARDAREYILEAVRCYPGFNPKEWVEGIPHNQTRQRLVGPARNYIRNDRERTLTGMYGVFQAEVNKTANLN